MRTMHWQDLEDVANHPEVRPYLGGDGEIRLKDLILKPSTFVFQAPSWQDGVPTSGGFVVHWVDDGKYEVHTMFYPGAPYKNIVRFMNRCILYMFVETDCIELWTRMPRPKSPRVEALGWAAKFHEVFVREGWSFQNVPLDRWACGCSTLEAEGEAFHAAIAAAKEDRGSELPIHPHDPAHERMVGIAMKMVRSGNATKAVTTYNAWASLAGYAHVQLLSNNPPVIDVQDAVVTMTDGHVEVLICR